MESGVGHPNTYGLIGKAGDALILTKIGFLLRFGILVTSPGSGGADAQSASWQWTGRGREVRIEQRLNSFRMFHS
jgi:hypothetical protein